MKIPTLQTPILLVTLLAAFGLQVGAQERPRITVSKDTRVSVAIRGLPGEAASILARDLELSGVAMPAGEGAANYIAEGAVSGGLSGRLRESGGGVVFDKPFSGGTLRAAVHRFADEIVRAVSGQPGIASSKIAFVSRRSGRKEIYLADYDGANVTQLTRDGAISVSPAISPDGSRIAYTGYQSGYPDLYLVDLASGSRRPIVKAPGTNSGASFSPDGGRIALTMSRDGNPEIYVIGTGGGGGRRLTRNKATDSSPTWAPSGGEIAFASDAGGSPQLFRMSASGGGVARIPTGFAYATEPSWSPDGSRIAFTARTGGGLEVATIDIRTGASRVLTSGGGEDPAWGANSRHLIYSSESSIYLLDTLSGRKTAIISGMGKVSEPTWTR